MAPEIVHKKPYDYRVDIWSLGVLLYELIHREAPYKGRSLSEISKSLAKDYISFSSSTHPEAKDLILKILKTNPNDRISMSQILSHPWIQLNLKAEGDSTLPVEDFRVSPRDVLRQENSKGIYGESPRIFPKRDHLNFRSEILASCDNELHVESIGSQTRTHFNTPLLSSFHGSSTLKDSERERLREKAREKERSRAKETINSSENHTNYSGNQRKTPTYDFNLNQVLRSVDENIASVRNHTKSYSTMSNNALEKLGFEDKARKNRIFENDILSPNFKTKVDNIIHQLSSHTTTHKSSEHTPLFSSRTASRPQLQQPSQNALSESSSIYRHYNESCQPSLGQQPQIISRAKLPSRLDENLTPTASPFASPFASTFRMRPDVENMRDVGYSQQTAKDSYYKKVNFSNVNSQSSLYAPASTTNRSVRSKMGPRDLEIMDDKNFSLNHKYSHTDVTKSLNLKSFGNILSTADQNKYRVVDVQEASSSFNKYSKGLDYKRNQGYRVNEDQIPINMYISSSLNDRRNENKENKTDHFKGKESYMRIREEYTGRLVF